MAKTRMQLKQQLIEERGVCDWCGGTIYDDADMHEWLIKRSNWPKDKRIFSKYNSAILHHQCHMEHGQTKAMRERLAPKFVERYGKDAIIAFVENLNLRSGREYINTINHSIV